MSRTAALLLLAVAAQPASAQAPDPAGQAIADQRAQLRQQMRLDCPPAEDESEIVVCGSRAGEEERRYRLSVATPPSADVSTLL